MVQLHLPFHRRQLPRRGVRGLGRLLQQLKDTSRTGQGILQLRDDTADLIKWLGVLIGVAQKGGESPTVIPPDTAARAPVRPTPA